MLASQVSPLPTQVTSPAAAICLPLPCRAHPELPQLPPFNEVANEQAKVADLALDQAAIPSVVPVPVE
jgi:hypothetical protein